LGSQVKSALTISDISGRTIKDIILCLFTGDQELALLLAASAGGGNDELCLTCFNLLEQVDAFEMHLNRTRDSLVMRRERKIAQNGSGGAGGRMVNSRRAQSASLNEINLDALSQLPPSTKVETVLKVEPEDNAGGFNNDNEDYFGDISGAIDNDFVSDLYAELTVKKEIVDPPDIGSSGFGLHDVFGTGIGSGSGGGGGGGGKVGKRAGAAMKDDDSDDSDDREQDEDYVPPGGTPSSKKKGRVSGPVKERVIKAGRPPKRPPADFKEGVTFSGGKKLRLVDDLPEVLMSQQAQRDQGGVTSEGMIRKLLPEDAKEDDVMEIVKMAAEFELDVAFFRDKLPQELKTPEDTLRWHIILMRSEMELTHYGMAGELSCFDCNQEFDSVAKKVEHMLQSHTGVVRDKMFTCEFCTTDQVSFDDEDAAFAHMESEHGGLKTLMARQTSEREPTQNPGDDRFLCGLCGVASSTELGYWYHWSKRHPKYKGLACPLCGVVFSSTPDLRRHVLITHLGYKYNCNECVFVSVDDEEIAIHVQNHIDSMVEKKKSDYMRQKQRYIKTQHDLIKSNKKNKIMMASKFEAAIKDEDGGEDGEGGEKYVGRALKSTTSQWAKRSRENVPLNVAERAAFNSDQYLIEQKGSYDALKHIPQLKADLDEHIELLKTMPSIIADQETAINWDVALLKTETTRLTFGIPGENKCFTCDALTSNSVDKHTHLLSVHGNGENGESYKCNICIKFYSSEDTAWSHTKKAHVALWKEDRGEKREPIKLQNGDLQCPYCTVIATSELAFWVHMTGRHKRFKNIRCQMCEMVCINAGAFRRHILIYHGGYKFKCPECPKTFRPLETYKLHVKEHERLRQVAVYEKKKAERRAQGLPETEPGEKEPPAAPKPKKSKRLPCEFYTCELCGKESRGEKFHAKHMYSQHGIESKINCDECNKECASIRELEDHRRVNHSVASCHLCGKSFFSSAHLTSHLRQVHEVGSKEDDFICEICARSFPTKAYLRIHAKVHKEKSIQCTLCPKMFRWESGYKSHLESAHSQHGKLHSCEFCGKQFKDKSNLKSHRYTHLDSKPHSCSKCGRGFIRRDMMLTHEKSCRT